MPSRDRTAILLRGQTLDRRFRVEALVRDALGVQELLARDLETGLPVVVGTVHGSPPGGEVRSRLESELRLLRDHPSPHLAALAHTGEGPELIYAVRPHVAGTRLADLLKEGPLPVEMAVLIVRDVLLGLAALHEVSLLHLDVQPGSVIVGERADHGVLAYLGLAQGVPDSQVSHHDLDPGAVRHLSPEQAGLLSADVDHRSDLYSVGALLFECLCGRSPFGGATVGDVLRARLSPRAPEIAAHRSEVPAVLQRVLDRLLCPRPEDRYRSAGAVAADLTRILEKLQQGEDPDELEIGADDASPTLGSPRLVGRQRELGVLRARLEAAREGRGSLVLLESESGGGKTALMAELEGDAAVAGGWTLHGQGVDRTADRPYQALEGVIMAVIAEAERDPQLANRLRARLTGLEAAVAAALPPLSGFLELEPTAAAADAAHGPALTRRGLAQLIDGLGTEARPVLLLLDDFQWADELSVELLREWTELQSSGGARHVLVIAAFRSDEVQADHGLRLIAAGERLALRPLTGDEVGELVESMAGVAPPGLGEVVAEASAGQPFMAVEVLRGLVEAGVLASRDGHWRLEGGRLPDTQASLYAAEMAAARIGQLPADVVEVLSVAAVLGKQFSPDMVARLVRRPATEVVAMLEEARRRHIVWLLAGRGNWVFVHDKLREALLSGLPGDRRRSLHLDIAEQLAETREGLAFDLAYHLDAAGETAQAVPHALAAAEDACRRYSLQIAQRYYAIAARGVDLRDVDAVRRIQEGMGDIALLRGEYDLAEQHLKAAQDASHDPLRSGEIEGKLGELAFKRGDIAQATERLENGLRMLGQRVPRNALGYLILLLVEIVVQIVHSLLPGRLGRRSLDGAERELVAMHLYSELAHAYWFGSGKVPCAWSHLRGLNLAERHPPTAQLAQAYSEHAPVMTMIPWFGRGIAYARRSLKIRRDLGDVWGEGQSLHFQGVVLYGASRYEEALESLHEAVRMLEQTGDQWEMSTARWHIAFCHYRLGRLTEAAEVSREVHNAAAALGDAQAQGISIGVWAKATLGQAPRELIDEALANLTADVHTGAEALQADALRRLATGETQAAIVALERADALVRRAGLRQEYVAPVLPWLATALRTAISSASPLAPRSRRLLRRARRVARRSLRTARFYRNNLPHALREYGLIAALSGRPRRARRSLKRSLAVAETQGARLEYALSARALAELEAVARPDDAEATARLERAERDLAALMPSQGAGPVPPVTLSLADRFDAVLDCGRTIASALSRDAVYQAVSDAAVALLRVESPAVFSVPTEGEPALVLGTLDGKAVRAAVKQAIVSGAAVTVDAIAAGPENPEGRPETLLCAVMRIREQPEACLVVSDRGVGLFGQEEERLAAYIVSLAGAALENSGGFAASEALSRSLEQMVEERTAALNSSKEEMASMLSLLAATLESTADGILVVDGNGRIVSHNGRFAEMWRIPREVLETRDDGRALRYVQDQLTEPERFVERVREITEYPEESSYDVLEFKDGRVFERFSMPQRVGGTATARVWSFHDLTRQKRSERELERLANHDGLTGLLNRRRFELELQQAIDRIGRHGKPAALLMLDLDNFKYVNDTLGHGAGDELIRSIATLLQSRLRDTDKVARLGGDEFAVLLDGADAAGAGRVGTDLLGAIRDHSVTIGGQRVSMTASIGVAVIDDGEAEVSQVLADADLAMYEVKRSGRDGISISAPERAEEARLAARLSWGERLRKAIEQDEFELHVQPVLDLRSTRVTRHEVLLRLREEDGKLLTPAHFLPSAERLGLMQAIDRWVVAHAIGAMAGWLRRDADRSLEINLSGTSIGDATLPKLIDAELRRHKVEPGQLIFEVTETATIANMEDAKILASAISDLGCEFALDDFGTGFGSFYYLKHLPVDYLKIDGDFIADLPDSETDQLIVRSIIGIARGMGKKTIAEFVSDRAILRWVRELGIDYAQGYFIGEPVPIAEITR